MNHSLDTSNKASYILLSGKILICSIPTISNDMLAVSEQSIERSSKLMKIGSLSHPV